MRPRYVGHAGPVTIGLRATSAAALTLWIPISSQLDGAALGSLVAEIRPDYIDALFEPTERTPGDDSRFSTIVADDFGRAISGARPKGLDLGAAVRIGDDASDVEGVSRVTFDGVSFLAATSGEPGYEDFAGLGWWIIVLEPEREALALDRLLTRASLLITLGMLLFAGVLGSLGARSVVGPIRDLAGLMERAATGDFTVRAHSTRRDEIGGLARAFDAMVADLVRIVAELADARHSQSVAEERGRLADLKTRFVAMASHEFRTPLAVILSASDSIRRYGERMTATQQDERLAKIATNVRFMTELLEDVLILGRAESGTKLQPANFDLGALCRELCEEIRAGIGSGPIRLVGDADTGLVCLDPKLTRQILRNLISNALKYSPDAAPVDVTIQSGTERIVVAVADHGIGIPVEDQARLFEPFQRATNVGEIQGTGLGLAITKKAVDLMGGAIMVASTLGEGTTFRLTLPRSMPPVAMETGPMEFEDAQGGVG